MASYHGSTVSSLKFVFRIQPPNVVLSVIDNAQSSLFKHPARISIHGLIIDAMNSSRLFEALKRKPGCNSNLQAKPYPPSLEIRQKNFVRQCGPDCLESKISRNFDTYVLGS